MPWAAWIVVGLVVVLLVGYEVIQAQMSEPAGGDPRTLCMLRNTTGVPCPSCGATRAAKAALRLDLAAGFGHNPLIMAAGVLFLGALLLRLLSGRALRVDASASGWALIAGILVVLLLLNWWWVLRQHGFLLGTSP